MNTDANETPKKTRHEMKKGAMKKSQRKPSKFMRREYGISDFLSWLHSDGGMRRAVRRVEYEDRQLKLFRSMGAKGKPVN